MANVRVPTATPTSSLLVGALAVQTQEGERSKRSIASSSLIKPALRSRSTAYTSSSCNCSTCMSQRKEAEKARSCQFLAQISHPDTPVKQGGKAFLERCSEWMQG